MPVEFTVKIHGLKELEQRLRDEPKKVAVKTLRAAGHDAGQVWKQAIEEEAPRDTAFLSEHINIATHATSGDDGSLRVMVGPSRQIYPRHAKGVTLKPGGKGRESGKGWTKGASEVAMMREFGTRFQPADPFMRRAFEGTKDLVLDFFVLHLKTELDALREK